MGHASNRPVACVLLALFAVASCGNGEPTSSSSLVVEPLQYRDDIVADRLQLQVTNGLDQPLPIRNIQLVWDGLSSPRTPKELTIGSGQRVDLPVNVGQPTCVIAGTQVQPAPSTAGATVVLTLTDGAARTAAVTDLDGTLAGLHAAGCERQMILQQVRISFDELHAETLDGRPITAGVLRVERGRADDVVSLISVGGTIPLNVQFPTVAGKSPLLVVNRDDAAGELPVQFVEGRCDAHAVAEAKQPFRFVVQVDLGDGAIRALVVEPDESLHREMLATVAQGCSVLGLDGTLQPEG